LEKRGFSVTGFDLVYRLPSPSFVNIVNDHGSALAS